MQPPHAGGISPHAAPPHGATAPGSPSFVLRRPRDGAGAPQGLDVRVDAAVHLHAGTVAQRALWQQHSGGSRRGAAGGRAGGGA